MRQEGRRALVVGGSVGGLFAANLLLRQGWDVAVFERVPEGFESRGTGIAHHPELEAIMARAGAEDGHAVGMRVEGRTAVDRHGRVAARHPLLQYVTAWTRVFNPLRAAFPAARYHGGRELRALEQNGAGAIAARFADGGVDEADLLVAADGFRSTVRGLVAAGVLPRYAGYVAWRAMVEEEAFSPAFREAVFERFTFGFLPGSQFVGYPVPGRGESAEPGRRRYNFLWYYPVDPGAALADLLTDDKGHTHAWSIPPARMRAAHVAALRREAAAQLPPPYGEAVERSSGFLIQPIYDLEGDAIAFIERRLDGPEADPALGLSLARVVEISGRPVQDPARPLWAAGPAHPD